MPDNIAIGKNLVIGDGRAPVIIAEAGINHDGDMAKAEALVREAAAAGADIIKFQAHQAEAEMLRDGFTADYVGESLFDLIERCSISRDELAQLRDLAATLGIEFLATPFSREAADMLEELGVSAYKIGSGEVVNIPLLRHIAAKKKPLILSTGMTSLEEVGVTLDAIVPINKDIVLLHCTSVYPTPFEDVRLQGISQLRECFGLSVGFSDHSPGVSTALGAVAIGACIIEKHFTLDRNWSGPDQAGSIEPSELSRLVKESKEVHLAMGKRTGVLVEEGPVQAMARESLVVTRPVKAGDLLTHDNLWTKRPGTGIPAAEYDRYLGRKMARNLDANSLLAIEDVA